jgi:hypothetical protein
VKLRFKQEAKLQKYVLPSWSLRARKLHMQDKLLIRRKAS